MPRLEDLLEGEKRGILPPQLQGELDEARKRGLIPSIKTAPVVTPATAQPQGQNIPISTIGSTGMMGSSMAGVGGDPRMTPNFKELDDYVRVVADWISYGTADEFAAWMGKQTGRKAGTYAELLEKERVRDSEIPLGTRILGMLTGAGLTGRFASLARLNMFTKGGSMLGNVGRGGAFAGVSGAVYGAGSGTGGVRSRLEQASLGAATGLGVGGTVGAIGTKLAQKTAIPQTAELYKKAQKAYRASEKEGVIISQGSVNNLVKDFERKVRDWGFNAKLYPRAAAALEEVKNSAGKTLTLKDADLLRQIIRRAGIAPDKGEGWMSGRMVELFDDFIGGLKPADLVRGEGAKAIRSLKKARKLWGRYRKADALEKLVERAKIRAPNFVGSGRENALRTEFRAFAMNPRKMRGYNKTERAAIERVAKGGKIGNILRGIGRGAVRGPVSAMTPIALGATGQGPLAGAYIGAAELSRLLATGSTSKNVRLAIEAARAGGKIPRSMKPPAFRGMMGPAATFGTRALTPTREEGIPAWLRDILDRSRRGSPR